MTDRELMQQALEALEVATTPLAKDRQEVLRAQAVIREALAEKPAQQTCLVANEPCKHDSWCSEVYCQEHCKFVEQPAQQQEPVAWLIWLHGPAGHFDHKQFAEMEFERRNKEYPDPDRKLLPLYTTPPQRKKLPPKTPCLLTQAENKMFRLGWLECEAAHGIKGEA